MNRVRTAFLPRLLACLALPLAFPVFAQDKVVRLPTAPAAQTPAKPRSATRAAASSGLEGTMAALVTALRSNAPRGKVVAKKGAVDLTDYSFTGARSSGCTLEYVKHYEVRKASAPVYLDGAVNHMRLDLSEAIPIVEESSSTLERKNFATPDGIDFDSSQAVYSFGLRFSADQQRKGWAYHRDFDEETTTTQESNTIRETHWNLQTAAEAAKVKALLNKAIELCQTHKPATMTTALADVPAPTFPPIKESVWLTAPEGPKFFGLQLGTGKEDMDPTKAIKGGVGVDQTYGPYIRASTLPGDVTKGIEGVRGYKLLEAKLYVTGRGENPDVKLWSIDANLWNYDKDARESDTRSHDEQVGDVLRAYRRQVQEVKRFYTVQSESYEKAKWPFECPDGSEVAQKRVAELQRLEKRRLDITDPGVRGYLGPNEMQVLAAHCHAIPTMETMFSVTPRIVLNISLDVSQLGGQDGTILESLYDEQMASAADAVWRKKKAAAK